MQVLDGRLATGNRYRITPYVIQVTDDNGEMIHNVDVQSLGDVQRIGNAVACWMKDGNRFDLGFDTADRAAEACLAIQSGRLSQSPRSLLSIVSPRQMGIALCALGVVIGSIGPWATVWVLTVDGLDGDGQITVVLGILAIVGLFARIRQPGSRSWIVYGLVAVLGLAAIIGGYDWANINDAVGELEGNPFAVNASVGWGLQLMTIAAVIGTAVGFAEAIDYRRGAR